MEQLKKRRRSRGSAWYWKQTDSWYYTPPATTKRVRLLGLDGLPIRGIESKGEAELALARVRAAGKWHAEVPVDSVSRVWIVARVCSEYLADCERRLSQNSICLEYFQQVRRHLNAFAAYCGAVPVSDLKKGHLEHWLSSQPTWRSTATQRNAITIVLSALLHAQENFDQRNPFQGFRKSPQRPRLQSIGPLDEKAIYDAANTQFEDFVFATIHTGLRPFCELARLTPCMVVESPHGMLWKVHSSHSRG